MMTCLFDSCRTSDIAADAEVQLPYVGRCRHRVSLGVHVDQAKPLIAQWRVLLEQADVKARIIVSGMGDFRYVDCVAANAGEWRVAGLLSAVMFHSRSILHPYAVGNVMQL